VPPQLTQVVEPAAQEVKRLGPPANLQLIQVAEPVALVEKHLAHLEHLPPTLAEEPAQAQVVLKALELEHRQPALAHLEHLPPTLAEKPAQAQVVLKALELEHRQPALAHLEQAHLALRVPAMLEAAHPELLAPLRLVLEQVALEHPQLAQAEQSTPLAVLGQAQLDLADLAQAHPAEDNQASPVVELAERAAHNQLQEEALLRNVLLLPQL